MTNWQTSNPVTWFQKLYWAIWDSVVALWDDEKVPWDAIGDTDWKTQNNPTWQAKQQGNWETPNAPSWYTKN